jgi:hypothetical protein
MREDFASFQEARCTLNWNSVNFALQEITFLRHYLWDHGVRGLPDQVYAVRNITSSNKWKVIAVPWARSGPKVVSLSVPSPPRMAKPFHAPKRRNAKFVWGDAQQTSFDRLRDAFWTPSISNPAVLFCLRLQWHLITAFLDFVHWLEV